MLASPRCGAKTRSGGSCRSPAVSGKTRCRIHGGANAWFQKKPLPWRKRR
ncbi:MAG: HGGxSTG domain-containing protein [Methyloceanibacter sp.]